MHFNKAKFLSRTAEGIEDQKGWDLVETVQSRKISVHAFGLWNSFEMLQFAKDMCRHDSWFGKKTRVQFFIALPLVTELHWDTLPSVLRCRNTKLWKKKSEKDSQSVLPLWAAQGNTPERMISSPARSSKQPATNSQHMQCSMVWWPYSSRCQVVPSLPGTEPSARRRGCFQYHGRPLFLFKRTRGFCKVWLPRQPQNSDQYPKCFQEIDSRGKVLPFSLGKMWECVSSYRRWNENFRQKRHSSTQTLTSTIFPKSQKDGCEDHILEESASEFQWYRLVFHSLWMAAQEIAPWAGLPELQE